MRGSMVFKIQQEPTLEIDVSYPKPKIVNKPQNRKTARADDGVLNMSLVWDALSAQGQPSHSKSSGRARAGVQRPAA
jgi:hypothetical protein